MPAKTLESLSSTGRSLLRATLHIAQANHYMVGFNRLEVRQVSYDDFCDVHRYLVDLEQTPGTGGVDTGTIRLAFEVLLWECHRQYGVAPS
jgi:hypothetical protein